MYGTEYGIRQGTDGEALGIINEALDRSELGGSSLGKTLVSEVGTNGVLSDGMSDGNIVG